MLHPRRPQPAFPSPWVCEPRAASHSFRSRRALRGRFGSRRSWTRFPVLPRSHKGCKLASKTRKKRFSLLCDHLIPGPGTLREPPDTGRCAKKVIKKASQPVRLSICPPTHPPPCTFSPAGKKPSRRAGAGMSQATATCPPAAPVTRSIIYAALRGGLSCKHRLWSQRRSDTILPSIAPMHQSEKKVPGETGRNTRKCPFPGHLMFWDANYKV
ncbi:uncharacterized protein LOC134147023 [Rhea pennata]|uniref:uncharacterized protein LOC134147023 n=1 Tax=Rhea pennata TaxID=8795 RepID=UPI002E257FA8